MNNEPNYLTTIKGKRSAKLEDSKQLEAVADIVQAVRQEHARDRIATHSVEVANPITSVATPDVAQVVTEVKKLAEAVRALELDFTPIQKDFGSLQGAVQSLTSELPNIPKSEKLESIKVSNLGELGKLVNNLGNQVDNLIGEVKALELKPEIIVQPAEVSLEPLDLKPILAKLDSVTKALSKPAKEPKQADPLDLTPLLKAVNSVDGAIKGLRFPIPNYIMPFKDADGKAVQVQLDEDGNLPTAGAASSAVLAATDDLTASGNVLVPTSGKKLLVTNVKFSLSADFTSVSLRFTSGGADFEKYLAPKSGGLYGISLPSGSYLEGGANQALYAVLDGTGTVQFNVKYTETT